MNTSIAYTGLRGLTATVIFGALAASFSAISTADPRPVSLTVKFADLNISTPSGAHVLYTRIVGAAQVVCSYYWFDTDAAKARCLHDAIANAVTNINQPALSNVYNSNNKTPAPNTLLSQKR